jgi:hypothetical protein
MSDGGVNFTDNDTRVRCGWNVVARSEQVANREFKELRTILQRLQQLIPLDPQPVALFYNLAVVVSGFGHWSSSPNHGGSSSAQFTTSIKHAKQASQMIASHIITMPPLQRE